MSHHRGTMIKGTAAARNPPRVASNEIVVRYFGAKLASIGGAELFLLSFNFLSDPRSDKKIE